jgi:hypothetical protein
MPLSSCLRDGLSRWLIVLGSSSSATASGVALVSSDSYYICAIVVDLIADKATFFLVQVNTEARLSDWQKVAQLGQEIGDHTETHPCRLGSFSAERFQRTQIAPMERFLDANFGAVDHRVYAYPCGFIGLGQRSVNERFGRYAEVLSKTFVTARTSGAPPNQLGRTACTCPASSCQALRDHIARFPEGSYRRKAADLLTARQVTTEDVWSPSTRQLALFQPEAISGAPDEAVARARRDEHCIASRIEPGSPILWLPELPAR